MPRKPKAVEGTMELGIGADYGWASETEFLVRVKVEGFPKEMAEELKTLAVMSILAKQVIPGDMKKIESGDWRVENMVGEVGEREEIQ